MLQNLLVTVEENAKHLQHITLLQGTKAYGGHLGPFRQTARESDPRHMPPNFYYNQQDLNTKRQAGNGWTWTVLRPRHVRANAMGRPLRVTPETHERSDLSSEYRHTHR